MSLDLNYKPNVFVETASLREDEWLAWRRKGVGGSDVAAALGLTRLPLKLIAGLALL